MPANQLFSDRPSMRKFHKILGLTLLLPFLGWAVTGVFFFIKPGYSEAYQSLSVKTYPFETPLPALKPNDNWQQVKWLKTTLGLHLMVKQANGWMHLNPSTLEPISSPSNEAVRRLIEDAILDKQERYGKLISLEGDKAITSTGAQITFNWSQMSLRQRAKDTDFIDRMYKIHYLQWTGIESIDKVLGIVGLGAVLILAVLGLRMAFPRRRTKG